MTTPPLQQSDYPAFHARVSQALADTGSYVYIVHPDMTSDLSTRLPLAEFYEEMVATQRILARKHLGARQLWGAARKVTSLLARGQTNFVRMLFKFNSVYDPRLQMADHAQPVRYAMSPPPPTQTRIDPATLYVHRAGGRRGRQIDAATEQFVDDTRMGVSE